MEKWGSPKKARVEEEVQMNEMMQDLSETKKELDRVTKILRSVEEDRDMWKRLFEGCNKKQGEELERLRLEYKEQSERLALTTQWKEQYPQGMSSSAVPDGASYASRTKPNNRCTSSDSSRKSNQTGPE